SASPVRRGRRIGRGAVAGPSRGGAGTDFGRCRRRRAAASLWPVNEVTFGQVDAVPGGKRRLAGAVVLLAVSGVLIAVTVWGRAQAGGELTLDIAVGAAGWLLSPLLLWRPVPAALALSVLAALSPAATPVSSMGVLHVAQRRPFPVAAA